jgi:small-conductance mechanosensitive channel
MSKIEALLDYFLGPLFVVIIMIACLVGISLLIGRLQKDHPESDFRRQVIMLVSTLIAIFLLVVLLPISDSLRGQILSLIGLLLSATIALSSTTFLGNALAGILLRNVRSFHIGDFIYINEQFGRVSGRGLFHIEIQTEDRDLVTLPNLFVTNNPVKVTRESGTVISSKVSLGYDVPHSQIETLLQQAAKEAGLEDPFVYILELGDFSILYQANGMLKDVKQLISARSRLNGAILDTLHGAEIEIVSPNFMNTRDVSDQKFTARSLIRNVTAAETKGPEDIIFDKAEQAATLEESKIVLVEIEQRIETLEKELANAEENNRSKISVVIERLKSQQAQLTEKLTVDEKIVSNEKKKN